MSVRNGTPTARHRLIDSHAHLADPAFDADRADVIARARAAGLLGVVCIGESLGAAERAAVIAAENAGFVAFTAGVHPHDAASFDAARDVPAIREHLLNGAVAVGECGLDYHYDHSPRDRQRAAFSAQLELARELDVAVVVHTREAEADTQAMVVDAGRDGVRGVLHCYTGSHELAGAALDVGWYVSFSGIVTFKKFDDAALLRLVPEDRLLVESDAPYLAPVPFRGKRNEPAFVSHTIERLVMARAATREAMVQCTTSNARRLFGLAVPDGPS